MKHEFFEDDFIQTIPRNGRQKRIEHLIEQLLVELGEDPTREGLANTPRRVANAFSYLTEGYTKNLLKTLNNAVFEEDYNEMVIVKDIDYYSMCEHHLLPFFGKCHVAYIPNGKIIGLSKLPRIVDIFARRLQIQERMTQEIANALRDLLNPRGVAVVCEARHMCMMMRGVQKQNSVATTSAMIGEFSDNPAKREEFLKMITTNFTH